MMQMFSAPQQWPSQKWSGYKARGKLSYVRSACRPKTLRFDWFLGKSVGASSSSCGTASRSRDISLLGVNQDSRHRFNTRYGR